MSKNPVRKDKTCLNCNYVVENRFCPSCGQENTDTRKTFHHLFVHFFEDLTHYENAFWKTIRNLIFRPGSLTKEYLSGKRMSYLAPVRLYIFISFVTFFILTVLPSDVLKTEESHKPENGKTKVTNNFNFYTQKDSINQVINQVIKDSIQHDSLKNAKRISLGDNNFNYGNNFGFGSLRKLDSVQKYGHPEDRLSPWEYWLAKKAMRVVEHNTPQEIKAKFIESFFHNFPKVLFIYMPIFAFVLWLFQDKKKWYYFDHGIFTLHYFSFLLLGNLIMNVFQSVTSFFDSTAISVIVGLMTFVIYVYMCYYFFPAHHRFYGERRRVTIVKGITMFIINSILAGIIMLAFIVYTFLNIH